MADSPQYYATPQEQQDLESILAAFPDSVIVGDGWPLIKGGFDDLDGDRYEFQIDCEGVMNIQTDGMSHVLVSAALLRNLAGTIERCDELLDDWKKTPSGVAWEAGV